MTQQRQEQGLAASVFFVDKHINEHCIIIHIVLLSTVRSEYKIEIDLATTDSDVSLEILGLD